MFVTYATLKNGMRIRKPSREVHYADTQKHQKAILRYPDETVDALLEFGSIVLAEASARSAQLDSKLGTYLAYSAGLIGLLSIGTVLPQEVSQGAKIALGFSVVFAIAAMGFAGYGMRSRDWPVPSERTWFCDSEIMSPQRLRRSHAIALLASHQSQNQQNVNKSIFSEIAEYLLAVSAIIAGLTILARLL
jgi:hypothetical protein